MLKDHDVAATIGVKDAAGARAFYEGVLGLGVEIFDEKTGVAVYRTGRSKLIVYVSGGAGTNRATSATWGVGERLEEVVGALQAKGVPFERYEIPGAEMRGDIHVFGDFRAAWFTDPEGNILHVNSG